MGYYTYYTLEVFEKDRCTQISEELEAQLTKEIFRDWYTGDEEVPNTFVEVIGYDSYKWYNHDEDIQRVAMQHPDLYFVLEGRGEEFDDMWTKVYHGDKRMEQFVEIIYPSVEYMMEEIDDVE